MRFAVLDACFPIEKQSLGMAALWLKWELLRYNIDVVSHEKADVLLVSCVDPSQAGFIRRLRAKHKNKIIFSGGAGALSPHALSLFSDAVCVGDGRLFLKTLIQKGVNEAVLLDNVFVNGETRNVSVDQNFPWDCPPIQAEDGSYRVLCGHGCKMRCAFCQTGWALEYKENPNPSAVLMAVDRLKRNGKKFGYITNDLAQHSFFRALPASTHGSYSVAFMKKNGLPHARQIRIGVEGVSARMRRLVGKPISYDDLLKCTVWLNENKKSVRWFIIAGLPGEKKSDWEELKSIVQEWKIMADVGVLALSFTAFKREPSAPLGFLAHSDEYIDFYDDFREWFFGGVGFSNRIKIMSPAGIETRNECSELYMGVDPYVDGWGPNDRVLYKNKPYRQGALDNYVKAMQEQHEKVNGYSVCQ